MSDAAKIAKVLAAASAIMLIAAAFGRWPYGFYTFLRLVVCGSAAFMAYLANGQKRLVWVVTLGAIAVLFNPIIPVHLTRSDWMPVDLVVAVVFVLAGVRCWDPVLRGVQSGGG
jgi:hypothetical protein